MLALNEEGITKVHSSNKLGNSVGGNEKNSKNLDCSIESSILLPIFGHSPTITHTATPLTQFVWELQFSNSSLHSKVFPEAHPTNEEVSESRLVNFFFFLNRIHLLKFKGWIQTTAQIKEYNKSLFVVGFFFPQKISCYTFTFSSPVSWI